MHFSIDRTVHTTAFDKPVVDHWLERKIAQTAAGSTEKDRSDDRPLQRRARYQLSYILLPIKQDGLQIFSCWKYELAKLSELFCEENPAVEFGNIVRKFWN